MLHAGQAGGSCKLCSAVTKLDDIKPDNNLRRLERAGVRGGEDESKEGSAVGDSFAAKCEEPVGSPVQAAPITAETHLPTAGANPSWQVVKYSHTHLKLRLKKVSTKKEDTSKLNFKTGAFPTEYARSRPKRDKESKLSDIEKAKLKNRGLGSKDLISFLDQNIIFDESKTFPKCHTSPTRPIYNSPETGVDATRTEAAEERDLCLATLARCLNPLTPGRKYQYW